MTTALTLYGNKTASATLTTAATFFAVTGGTESTGGGVTTAATGNGWLECDMKVSSGNGGAASGSIGSPAGNGVIWDVTTLEGQTMVSGTWTWKFPVAMSTTSTTFDSVTARIWKYNGGAYTSIASTTLTSQAVTTSKTTLTFTFSSVPNISFVTGDKLYVDVWFQLTGGWGSTRAFVMYRSGGASNGFAGDSELDTPGYNPTLTANKDITTRGKIAAQPFKDITVRGKVSASARKDVTTRGKINALVHKDITVRGNIFDRPQSGGAALFGSGTGTASYDSFRVTQYPDPSAPLTNAGRASNSIVNWNANLPANTGLTVYTSTDNGITFQQANAAGNTIPGISTLLYSTRVLQRKPTNYYHLSESAGSSTVGDSSGNNNAGAVNGGVTLGVAGALQGPGELGDTSAQFDGSTGYISFTSGITSTGSDFWVELWANVSSFANVAGASRRLLTVNIDNTSGFQVALQDTHSAFVWAVNDPTGQVITSKGGFSTGVWYHIIGQWQAATRTATMYINGVAQTNDGVASGYGIGAMGGNIGRRDNAGYFAGSLAEISMASPTIANAVAPFVAADALARFNAGLSQVGTVADDSFTADTHTSYTSTNGTGGSTATWTWDTANSRLIASGGSKALLLYNNLGAYDNDLWVDLYQSENAGLVWGWRDASNYYEMIVKDSGASVSPNTLILNKVSAGTTTLLSSASITFPVQTHHRFHVTMLDAVITISMDENQILTYTDSSPFPAGSSGLRNDTGTSYIYMLQITPQAADLTATALCSKHVLTTTDATVTPQVTDHQAMASDSSFGIGAQVPSADYRNTYVSDNIDAENTRSNYWWQVGDTSVTFQPRNAVNAPYILQSSDILIGTLPTVEYSGDMYRNEQVLTGVFDTSIFTQLFTGDGQAKTWNVANPVQAVPTITLNGLVQTVGIQGTDTGKAFYYQTNSTAITQDNSGTTLTSADTLSVAYLGAYGIDFSLANTGQISNTISQAQYAATDGTSGIVDAIEDVSQKNMNVDAATDYANTLLQRYGSIARTIVFDTLHPGLKAGHSLTIFVPQLNIFDSVFLVVEVQINARTITVNGAPQTQYVFHVTASENASLSSWVKYFSKVMRSVTGTKAKA